MIKTPLYPTAGYTLLEILISILIFSSIFISVGWVYNKGQKILEAEEEKRIAIVLAQQLVDEIMTKDMRDPDEDQETNPGDCWECDNITNYTRLDLDDVDDYDMWDRGIAIPLETPDGTYMDGRSDTFGNPTPDYSLPPNQMGVSGFSLFRRQVRVISVTPQSDGSVDETPSDDTGFLQVTVMVTSLRDYDIEEPGLQVSFSPIVLTKIVSHTYR